MMFCAAHNLNLITNQKQEYLTISFLFKESIHPTPVQNCGFHNTKRQFYLLGAQALHHTHGVWFLDPLQEGKMTRSHLDGQDMFDRDRLGHSET